MATLDQILEVVQRIEQNQSLDHAAITQLTSRVTALEPRVGALETSQPALPPMRQPSSSLVAALESTHTELRLQTPLLTRQNALSLGTFIAMVILAAVSAYSQIRH